jgi:alpha-beta hydrolase superfamily lysophospholipase
LSTAEALPGRPAGDFGEAAAAFAELAALDGAEIAPSGRSRFLAHGSRTPLSVVLLHGFTNAPEQWAQFAARLHERGHSVVVPRLPGHGRADRDAAAVAGVSPAAYLQTTNRAIDIARGCGERVAVAGLSLGGTLAVRAGQDRGDLSRIVAIVPLFGVFNLGAWPNSMLASVLGALPSATLPWDPRGDPRSTPPHAYARFPTRGLAVALRLGLGVYDSAARRVPAARTTMLLNAREPAVSNPLSEAVAARFAAARAGAADVVVLADLPANHDIIDPTNPQQRTAEVYPRVEELIES